MSKQSRIHAVLSVLTGIAAIVAGLCLIIACIGIWGSEGGVFSREIVDSAFTPIAIPVYLCLILVLAGWVANAISPAPEQKVSYRHMPMLLHRARAKADLSCCEESVKAHLLALQRTARRWRMFAIAVCALAILAFLLYALNPGHYSAEDVTGSVRQAVLVLLPCLAAAMAGALAAEHFISRAAEAELALLKTLGRSQPIPLPAKKLAWLSAVQLTLAGLAIIMIAYGALSGGTTDVLAKAVNICTECVGLG